MLVFLPLYWPYLTLYTLSYFLMTKKESTKKGKRSIPIFSWGMSSVFPHDVLG